MSIFQFHSSRFKAPPRNVLRYQRGVFLIQRIRLQKELRIGHYSCAEALGRGVALGPDTYALWHRCEKTNEWQAS